MQPVETAHPKFTGTISLQLTDLIQMVCLSRSDLIIDIVSQKGKGSIHIKQGRIHHAQTDGLMGEEAFFEVLRWNDGKFEILPFVNVGLDSVDKPWEHLLLEAVRHQDESNKRGGEDESGKSPLGQSLEEPSVGDLFDEIDDVFGKLVQGEQDSACKPKESFAVAAPPAPVKVLIVDDSSFFAKKLKQMLEADPGIQVAGIAKNGKESLDFLKSNPPVDLITLDIEMPVMPGDTALKHIMIAHRIPVVIVSSVQPEAMDKIFDFLQLGAVDFFGKPRATEDLESYEARLRALVKGAAKARVSNFKRLRKQTEYNRLPTPRLKATERKILVVAGGEGSHADWFRMPFHDWYRDRLVIGLQKLPCGFVPNFVQLLGKTTGLKVEPLSKAGTLSPGRLYLGNAHCRADFKLSSDGRFMDLELDESETLDWTEGMPLWLDRLAERAGESLCVAFLSAADTLPEDIVSKLLEYKARLVLASQRSLLCSQLTGGIQPYGDLYPDQVFISNPDCFPEVL